MSLTFLKPTLHKKDDEDEGQYKGNELLWMHKHVYCSVEAEIPSKSWEFHIAVQQISGMIYPLNIFSGVLIIEH